MSLPQISDSLGGYQYDWAQECVRVVVSRLKTHTDGRLTGELVITTTAPGAKASHLHQAQFNFSASRSRSELAKSLKDSYSEVDWKSILEQVCVYTLERMRRGEPVIDLYSGAEVQPPEYLIFPFVIKNYPNLIFGAPGSTKSTLAIILSQIMLLPWADNMLTLTAPAHPVRCLYLDWETDYETIRWQLTMLQRGANESNLLLVLPYRRCSLPLYQDLEQIKKHIIETQAQVIIIDSLGLACGGELNEAGPALAFFGALRQLNVTSLITSHTAKQNDKHKSIYGSVFFEAQSRNVWEIQKQQEPGENEANIALYHRKPAPFQKLQAPLGFKFIYSNDSLSISPQDPKTIDEFLERLSTQQRILELLKSGAHTPKEVADILNISPSNARRTLHTLKTKNKIIKVDDKYCLLFQQ